MIVGIVGSEAAKFNKLGERLAKEFINKILARHSATRVVSGACHLGGIDEWAAVIGHDRGLDVIEYKPAILKWEGGYKQRNMQIAIASDIVYSITVNDYPPEYNGMKFDMCYHCKTREHIKSGGCWTMKEAQKMGKKGELKVIYQIPFQGNNPIVH